MKALQILLHSVRQVTGNFEAAVRVSAIPYTIQFAVGLLTVGSGMMIGQNDPTQMQPSDGGWFFLMAMLNLLVLLVTSIWAAVAWHRFVLKGETPSGFVPPFNKDRIMAYFTRSFGIGLLCVVLAIPLGLLGAAIVVPFMPQAGPTLFGMVVIFFVTYVPIAAISYRLSTALPATALDTASAFSAGWDATKGQTTTFILLALLSVGLYFVVSEVGIRLFGGIAGLGLIWNFISNWIATLIGLSILTTLYGHYIEGRPLV